MKHLVFFNKCVILLLLFFFFDLLFSIVLINGLKKSADFNQNPEILINGSSMAGSGFNRQEIEKLTGNHVTIYTQEGVSVFDRFAMINHFFHMYPAGIKTVIYEVSPVLLSDTKTSVNVYTLFFPFMDDKTINSYIKENASPREYYVHKIIRTTRFKSRSFISIVSGYLGMFGNVKTNTLDTTALVPLISEKGKKEIIIQQANREIFENTMDTILSYNSNIVLVMMPMYYIKFQTFNGDSYKNLCSYFENYCSVRKGIRFIDLNHDSLIFNPGYFSDQLHFNVYGQRRITKIISSYIVENKNKSN